MLPLVKPEIQVIIVTDSGGQPCEGNCGLDWSLPATITEAGERIKASFGDRVEFKHLNLSEAGEIDPELPQKVRSQELSLPLLLIDGEVRISGRFGLRMLMDAISAEIEIKQG